MAGYDVIVIGGGHNGLVAAAYLAKGGLRTLVLERRDEAGGGIASVSLAGATVPEVACNVGRMSPSVVNDLALKQHGLELLHPAARTTSLLPDRRPLTLWADIARTGVDLQTESMADSVAYPKFDALVRNLSGWLAGVNAATPPEINSLRPADALTALRLGRAFRSLPRRDGQTLLRVLPMAVADFVAEHFESDSVRAAIAVRGVTYTAMGPWSAGTAAVLLNDSAGTDGGAAGAVAFARGGPGALASAIMSSARAAGAQIRTSAEVVSITHDEAGRAGGVVLANGEEFSARAVVSGLDPKRTLTTLVDPVVAGPRLMWRGANIRMRGTVAKVNLVLGRLPNFSGAESEEQLTGRIVVAPAIDYLERAHDEAKYGRSANAPLIEAYIPTLTDASLTGDGRHVLSSLVQYVPYHRSEGDWDADRDNLGDFVVKTLEEYAPGLSDAVEARSVLTPLDLERDYGFTEGHPLHGEPGLDQWFAWRPMLGHARYRFGIPGLYLCGSGAHPGGGVTGAPGANAARVILADLKRRRSSSRGR